jgi:hypothetical protein
MNQDGSVFASNAPLSLAGQKVVSGVAFKTGALRLVFESGARLTVPFGEEHETWQTPVRQGVCGFHSQAMASPPSRAPNNDRQLVGIDPNDHVCHDAPDPFLEPIGNGEVGSATTSWAVPS